MRKSSGVVALVITSCLGACDRSPTQAGEAQRGAEPALQRLGDLGAQSRDEAQATLERELERLRGELERFCAQAQERGERGREQLIAELEEQRDRANGALAELRACGAERWRSLCAQAQQEAERFAAKCRTAAGE